VPDSDRRPGAKTAYRAIWEDYEQRASARVALTLTGLIAICWPFTTRFSWYSPVTVVGALVMLVAAAATKKTLVCPRCHKTLAHLSAFDFQTTRRTCHEMWNVRIALSLGRLVYRLAVAVNPYRRSLTAQSHTKQVPIRDAEGYDEVRRIE
jgi:hypothetical protein